jgi:hypothetical protein
MVGPLRLDPTDARRRFDAARQLIEGTSSLSTFAGTLDRIDDSLRSALSARSQLLATLGQIDAAGIDRELKQALRRVGKDAPEVRMLQERRQVVIELHDEIDDVDEHVHRTILDVEALAARGAATAPRPSATDELTRNMAEDLALLKADTAALEAARRELEGL